MPTLVFAVLRYQSICNTSAAYMCILPQVLWPWLYDSNNQRWTTLRSQEVLNSLEINRSLMQVSNLQKVLVWKSFYVHTIYFKEQSPTHCIEYTMSLLFKTVLTPPAIAPAMRDLKVYGSTGPGNQKKKPPTVSSKMLWKPIVWDISWERVLVRQTSPQHSMVEPSSRWKNFEVIWPWPCRRLRNWISIWVSWEVHRFSALLDYSFVGLP